MKLLILLIVLVSGAFFLYNRDLRRAEEIREQQRIEQEELEIQRIKEEKALLVEKEKQEKLKIQREAERKKEAERIRQEQVRKEKEKEAEAKRIAQEEERKAREEAEKELQRLKAEAEAQRLKDEEEAKRLASLCKVCNGTKRMSKKIGAATLKVECTACAENKTNDDSDGQETADQIKRLQAYIEKTQKNNQSLNEQLEEAEKFSSTVDNFINSNSWYFSSNHIRKRTKGVNDTFYYRGRSWPTMREIYDDWENISETIYKTMASLKAPYNVNSPLRMVNTKCSMNQTPRSAVPEIKKLVDQSIDYLKKYIESQKSEIAKAQAKLSELQNTQP